MKATSIICVISGYVLTSKSNCFRNYFLRKVVTHSNSVLINPEIITDQNAMTTPYLLFEGFARSVRVNKIESHRRGRYYPEPMQNAGPEPGSLINVSYFIAPGLLRFCHSLAAWLAIPGQSLSEKISLKWKHPKRRSKIVGLPDG